MEATTQSKMTDEEWDAISLIMDQCWRGGFDDAKAGSYRVMLADYSFDEVLTALKALDEQGMKFVPSTGEIKEQVNGLREWPVPSWTEVWDHMERALRAGSEQKAIEIMERCHPVAAAFLRVEGYTKLSQTPFYDADYGAIRQAELKARWQEFVGVAASRAAQGRALDAGGRREGLPQRLSQAALLSSLRPVKGELKGGEDAAS